MQAYCTYCNTLHRAFSDQNYCSKKGDEISQVRSNAYYFQSKNLISGDHISRLSIRTINTGFQTHVINGREYLLDKDQYLIVPEGAAFESHVNTNNPIEGLLVAFSSHDINAFQYWIDATEDDLLDDPFDTQKNATSIPAISLPQSPSVAINVERIKTAIKTGIDQSLYYEEHFVSLLAAVLDNLKSRKEKIRTLPAKKLSTKTNMN